MTTATTYQAGPTGLDGEPARREVVLSFVGEQTKVHTSGMVFPQNLPERSWERIGASLRELTNSSAWWLADWLIFGETAYGWRRYREAVERTGLDYQTLRNYAWVARRFEHHRRRDSLSFAHHAEVTRMSAPEQDYWLRQAERLKWSRNELRRSVRASLAEQTDRAAAASGGGVDGERAVGQLVEPAEVDQRGLAVTTLTIELSAGQLDHFSKVAAANGLPVDKWVAQVLDAAERHTPERRTA